MFNLKTLCKKNSIVILAMCIVLVVIQPSTALALTQNGNLQFEAGAQAGLLYCEGGRLFTGVIGGSDSLRCYSTSSNTLNWSLSLGTDIDGDHLPPIGIVQGSDSLSVYVAAAQTNVVHQIDIQTGLINNTYSCDDKVRHIFSQAIDSHDVVFVVTGGEIKLLNADLSELALPIPVDPAGEAVSHAAFNPVAQSLYTVIWDSSTLIAFDFNWVSTFQWGQRSTFVEPMPFKILVVDPNQIAVVSTGSPSVMLFEPSTLLSINSVPGLTNVADAVVVDNGHIAISSYYQPAATDFNGAVGLVDIINSTIGQTAVPNGYPLSIANAHIPNRLYVVDAGEQSAVTTGTRVDAVFANGRLLEVDTSTNSILSSLPIEGGSVNVVYCAVSGNFYVGQGNANGISVFI